MNRLKAIVILLLVCAGLMAQNTMRVNRVDGTYVDIPVSDIEDVTFINQENPVGEATLAGQWLWGSKSEGYFELLTFNEDGSFIGYDKYFEFGTTYNMYGTYTRIGSILNLRFTMQGYGVGAGYTYRYQLLIQDLTEYDLSVMTQYENYTYSRLQKEVFKLSKNQTLKCSDGDYFVFADDDFLSGTNTELKAINTGTTYILKYLSSKNHILAYKVVVE